MSPPCLHATHIDTVTRISNPFRYRQQVNPTAPVASLELEWVFGYSSGRGGPVNTPMANNICFNTDGGAVYPAAALGVILAGDNTQKHFTGHDDDVLCLACTADRRFVATGQVASRDAKSRSKLPFVCVWDAADGRLITTIKDCHQRAVSSVAFSPDGMLSVSPCLRCSKNKTLSALLFACT